jgi:hypothetical protein
MGDVLHEAARPPLLHGHVVRVLESVPRAPPCGNSKSNLILRNVLLYYTLQLLRSESLSPVRGTSKKNEKRKRAEAVEGPSPGGVWGGNRRVY